MADIRKIARVGFNDLWILLMTKDNDILFADYFCISCNINSIFLRSNNKTIKCGSDDFVEKLYLVSLCWHNIYKWKWIYSQMKKRKQLL